MTKTKKIKMNITLHTEQSEYVEVQNDSPIPLIDDEHEQDVECEQTDLYTEGMLEISSDGKCTLSYDESELTQAPFSRTSLHFEQSCPELVTLMRTGEFRVAMVFEPESRHICVYETPFMPIEMCIVTQRMKNTVGAEGGELSVRYCIETNGMRCERARIKLKATPAHD